jgi:hypothetical protein
VGGIHAGELAFGLVDANDVVCGELPHVSQSEVIRAVARLRGPDHDTRGLGLGGVSRDNLTIEVKDDLGRRRRVIAGWGGTSGASRSDHGEHGRQLEE